MPLLRDSSSPAGAKPTWAHSSSIAVAATAQGCTCCTAKPAVDPDPDPDDAEGSAKAMATHAAGSGLVESAETTSERRVGWHMT